MGLRRFFRLLLDKNWQPPVASVDDSLAKTAHDTRNIGGPVPGGGFLSGVFPLTKSVHGHLAKGHKNYAKSFKKKND